MRHTRHTAGSAALSIAVTFILLTSQASQVRLSHQQISLITCPCYIRCLQLRTTNAYHLSALYGRAMQGSRLLQSGVPASPQQPAAVQVLPPIPQADAASSPGSAEPTRRASPSTSNPVAIHINPPESPAQADAGQQSPTSSTTTTPNTGGAAFTSGAQWHSSAT